MSQNREPTLAEKIRAERAQRSSRNSKLNDSSEPKTGIIKRVAVAESKEECSSLKHMIDEKSSAPGVSSQIQPGSESQMQAQIKLSKLSPRIGNNDSSLKECKSSDIAELMKTLRETREQADRTSHRLAQNREKAVNEQKVAQEERNTFIIQQETRDRMALKLQQESQGHTVHEGVVEEDQRDDIYNESSSGGGGANQLHKGLVVVQGRRDLISQLRQGVSQTINEEDDQEEDDEEEAVNRRNNNQARKTVERIRKEQDEMDQGRHLNYDLLSDTTLNPANSTRKSSNHHEERVAAAAAARGIASILKEVVPISELPNENDFKNDEKHEVEECFNPFADEKHDTGNRLSPGSIRADWDRRLQGSTIILGSDVIGKETAQLASSQSTESLACPICGRKFKKEMHLRLHKNVHERDTGGNKSNVALPKDSSPSSSIEFKLDVDDENAFKPNPAFSSGIKELKSNKAEAKHNHVSNYNEINIDTKLIHNNNDDHKYESPQLSPLDASRLAQEVAQGPDMNAMHRLWDVLQTDPNERGPNGLETGIVNEVLGVNSQEANMIALKVQTSQNAQPERILKPNVIAPPKMLTAEQRAQMTPAQLAQEQKQRQELENAQRVRMEAEAEEAAATAKKKAMTDQVAAIDSQRAQLEAMMEAMGAAGTKDLSTLSAHAYGRGGALVGKDKCKVTTLINDLAVDKIEDGELTMREAGAAMHAMMHQGGQTKGQMPNAAKLAAGTRTTGHINCSQHQRLQKASSANSINDQGRVALDEAVNDFPALWQKWIAKLSEKGLLDMAEGTVEREQQLERAAVKFLQCKAVVNAKARRNN